MRRSVFVLVGSVCTALSACSGCVGPRGRLETSGEITGLLQRQTDAWNKGDIAEFMEPYWHSADLTFSSGGKTTRSWRSTFDRYLHKYPTRDDMGELTFSDLEVREVVPGAALVLGRWRLKRANPIGGNFSLVLRRDGDHWVIIHDHTSTDSP